MTMVPDRARPVVALGGSGLTTAQVAALASRRADAVLAPDALARVEAAARFGARVAARRHLYGRTTGVGANRTATVSAADWGMRLLRSHAAAVGPLRSRERLRAALAVRINQLAAGGSGVAPEVVRALLTMLTTDALPRVREGSGIGTGDLSVWAAVGLAAAGALPTEPALPGTIVIGSGDALAVMSSNAATLADAALATVALTELAAAAITVAALTHVAVAGNAEAYSAAAAAATPFPGAQHVCHLMRSLLGTGDGDGAGRATRIQDPFALRALPQTHGPLLDRLDEMRAVFSRMANTACENPVLLPGTGIAHHGGFFASYLAQAADATRVALAQAGQGVLGRLGMLIDPAMTDLTPFLGDERPGASGVMLLEYNAAAALARLRVAATPLSAQSVSLSRGMEEDASFATQAVGALSAAAADYRQLLACELVAAVRAIRMAGRRIPDALADTVAACDTLPAALEDRDLSADIDTAEALLPLLVVAAERH